MESKLDQRIDTYKNRVIEMQEILTGIPAISPENNGDGEFKKAEALKTILEKMQFDSIREIKAPDERASAKYRPSLFAKMKGKSSEKTIWVMAHMDVVPAGDESLWLTDPFKARVEGDLIYGRGTEDNQQGMVSGILAVQALLDENIDPEFDVGLALVADEENGSKFGIEYALDHHPEIFSNKDFIIIPDAGDEEGLMVEVAEKSILWIRVEVAGKQTHGSTPEKGANAHKAGAHLIVKMNELYSIYNKIEELYNPPISTFEPTKKEKNVDNVNTIPGKDVFYFDCRILPGYDLGEIKNRIRSYADEIEKAFDVKVSLSYPQDESAPQPTPVDAPVVKALAQAIREVKKKEANIIGIGGGTVAAYFRKKGLPAVCWSTLDDTLHGPNEYSKISNTLEDAKIMARIFTQKS